MSVSMLHGQPRGTCCGTGLDLYLEACVESTAHLLSLPKLTPLFSTTVDYLGQLAQAGKLEPKKRGKHWYASKAAVGLYFRKANAGPRGRPRHKL
jgi:cell filamentation protein, protein adenylyltransferase